MAHTLLFLGKSLPDVLHYDICVAEGRDNLVDIPFKLLSPFHSEKLVRIKSCIGTKPLWKRFVSDELANSAKYTDHWCGATLIVHKLHWER